MEAELIGFLFDKLKLRASDGREIAIPQEEFNLSDEDAVFLELARPPKLKIRFLDEIEKKNFAMIRFSEDRPPEWRGKFGVRIEQEDTRDYRHELTVEYFAIGREIVGDRYILLDRKKDTFIPSRSKEWSFELHGDRLVVLTDTFNGDLNFSRRGEQYEGYLVTVTDARGQVIATEFTRNWLPEHIENLRKLPVGSYMDTTCTRTYPTRPKNDLKANKSNRL
jgi:hypothetical protein